MNDLTKTEIGALNSPDLTVVPGPAISLASASTGTDEDKSPTGDFANSFTDTTNPFGQLNVNGSATGVIDQQGDHDWFKMQLVAGHGYILNERGTPNAVNPTWNSGGSIGRPNVTLHDGAGTALATDPTGFFSHGSGLGEDAQLVFHVGTSGTYYADAAGVSEDAGTYTLDLIDVGTSTQRFAYSGYTDNDFSTNAGGWTSQNQYPRLLGDVNGNGLADIVGFAANGVNVALSTGNGHYEPRTLQLAYFGANQGWTSQDQFPRQVADVSGDGRADLVGFFSDGVHVALNNGNGQFASPTYELIDFGSAAGGWTSQNQYPRLVADVNGDGMADIVGFASDGVHVALAAGGGHFNDIGLVLPALGTNAGGWTSEDQYPRLLADLNGDGMADIIGFASTGAQVSVATGSGHFAPPVDAIDYFGTQAGGWTTQNQYPRQVADVNGDGKADIVGFASTGVQVALNQTSAGEAVHFAAPSFDVANFGTRTNAGGWTSQDQYPRLFGDVTGDGRADLIGFGGPGIDFAQSHDFLFV